MHLSHCNIYIWALNKSAEKNINAFEHKCYRRVLKISWIEKRTNKSILQELEIEESWLLKKIRQMKLKYCEKIQYHEGLEKKIMEGYILGRKKMGRPKRRLVQDITNN